MRLQSVGIGLRQPHYRDLLDGTPGIDFVEVHSENFFADGGLALDVLDRVRSEFPLSLHGVGLSLGSADGISATHLKHLTRLAERTEPALISEHLCWAAVDGYHLNDLLPIPYTEEALGIVVRRVDQVQEALKRPILIENISAYLEYRESEMSETTFLARLAKQSGCKILFDVNNLYVNAINFGFDAATLIEELPPDLVAQYHLAGHLVTDECLIDDHGSRVIEPVWDLFRRAWSVLGPKPTLIEWDTNIPPLVVLLDEARIARSVQRDEPNHG